MHHDLPRTADSSALSPHPALLLRDKFKGRCEKTRLRFIAMDLITLHMLSSLLSVITQMIATIWVVFCAVSFFSLKPGASVRFAHIGLVYFFSSAFALSVIARFLMNVSRKFPLGGVAALIGACVLHLFFAFIVIVLYIGHTKS